MQNSTQILKELQDSREMLDQLNQTVQFFKDSTNQDNFDHLTKTNIMADVIAAINLMYDIEQQMLSTVLGFSYTKPAYNPSGNTYYGATLTPYLIKQPFRQFRHLTQIQLYYTAQIALFKRNKEEQDGDHFPDFVYDGLGEGTNQVVSPSVNPKPVGNPSSVIYAKTATWKTKELQVIELLTTINSVLMGDIPNVS